MYRTLDSEGNTVDFMFSAYRDRIAAKHLLHLALWHVGHLRPRVIIVDGHPAYSAVIAELKQTGELTKVCRRRPSPYMNNIIEQDHRFIKKRIVASQWFRSVESAVNTIQGYEAMHMIRKGKSPRNVGRHGTPLARPRKHCDEPTKTECPEVLNALVL